MNSASILTRIILFIIIFFTRLASAASQEPLLRDLKVEKKPGKESGPATAIVGGKVHRVVRDTTKAWAVMDSENILAIVPSKKPAGYQLRFYEGATGKSRSLGSISFTDGNIIERKSPTKNERPVFVLSGNNVQTKEPVVVVTDMFAIRAVLTNTSAPKVEGEALSYSDRTGSTRTQPLSALLGQDMLRIYSVKENGQPTHVQFLDNGSAVIIEPDGKIQNGRWWTDGETMIVAKEDGQQHQWAKSALTPQTGIPSGTRLVARLTQSLASNKTKKGSVVETVLVSPAFIDGKILAPSGTKIIGTATEVDSVGWGVGHEVAALTVDFNQFVFPNGRTQTFHGRLMQVENSKEKVEESGKIKGVRATGTLGYTAKGQVSSVAAVEPVGFLFTSVASTAMLGFAEPEILYPAGTELIVVVTAPMLTLEEFQPSIPKFTVSQAEREQFQEFLKGLPFRTTTQAGNKPSDVTNLLFLGSPEALKRAFQAAGWVPADELTAASTFLTLKTITGNAEYTQAPMSTLLLGGKVPIATLSKTTNTFASRHHLRIFDPSARFRGLQVLTSSSTQDIGIAFSKKQKTFIHVIDEYIDNERAKVANDLEFTGCVDAVEMVPRPWVPLDAYNSTGDRLRTDGAIAVLKLNDCQNPKTTPTDAAQPPNRLQRSVRNTLLTIRNDLWRGNLGYQGYFGARKLHGFMAKEGELKPEAGAWRKSDVAGVDYEGHGDHPTGETHPAGIDLPDDQVGTAAVEADAKAHRWDAPHYEIALHGGYLRIPSKDLELAAIFLNTPDPQKPNYAVGLADELGDGWSAGISVTLNSWRWVSNEFGYHHQRGKYRLEGFTLSSSLDDDIHIDSESVGLITRQFEYNVLVHARPRESRWRPYVAVGPTFQLMSLADAPLKRPAGPYRLGLQNIGIFKAAFDFGRTPPLEGGGIFQFGLQWGAGFKFRVHPRITLRTDYRQTWTKNPEFIRDSYLEYDPEGLDPSYNTEVVRVRSEDHFFQQRFTIGFAFTF